MPSTEFAPKKKGNCNVMVMWPRYVILLVISFNNILLNPPSVLTYHLVSDVSLFQYTKPHPSIIGNCFSYIVLLKCAPVVILFVEKHIISHYILFWLTSSPLPLLPSYYYKLIGFKIAISRSKTFFGSYLKFKTRRAWSPIVRLTKYSMYGTMGNWHLDS